jgi:predicted CXXCH cytochrome family protein
MNAFLLLLVVLGSAGWWFCSAVADGPNPHVDKMSACNDCHLRDPISITGKESGTNLFLADIETLCLRCHKEMTLSMSHPIGMKPTFSLPLDMFLDWKGQMTCTTCHYMHHNKDGVYGGGNDKYLRRNSKGKGFCLECHRQGFMSQKGLSHALASEVAHNKQFSEFDTGELLGTSSSECLSCHDGTIASDGGAMSLNGNNRNSGVWDHQGQGKSYGGASSHPIGIDYKDAFRRNPQGIIEISMLPRTILLPDGKVECVSCHNLYTREANLLSVANYGSRLCLTCHKR